MAHETIGYADIKHTLKGKTLTVTVKGQPDSKKVYQLAGSDLAVNLNCPPLGSGPISMPGKIYCRVYEGSDDNGDFCQGLTQPLEINGEVVRVVSRKVRIPYGSRRFNPFAATLNEMRKTLGQKSDS